MSGRLVILHDGVLQQCGSPAEVYSNPHNMFVAGFIGSPPINFIDVEIVKKNGKIFLQKGDFKIGLPSARAKVLEKYTKSNRLVLGVRPQDIYDAVDLVHFQVDMKN